jgi:hypothetical protein
LKKVKPDPKTFVIPKTYTEEKMEIPTEGDAGSDGGDAPAAALQGLLKRFGR